MEKKARQKWTMINSSTSLNWHARHSLRAYFPSLVLAKHPNVTALPTVPRCCLWKRLHSPLRKMVNARSCRQPSLPIALITRPAISSPKNPPVSQLRSTSDLMARPRLFVGWSEHADLPCRWDSFQLQACMKEIIITFLEWGDTLGLELLRSQQVNRAALLAWPLWDAQLHQRGGHPRRLLNPCDWTWWLKRESTTCARSSIRKNSSSCRNFSRPLRTEVSPKDD